MTQGSLREHAPPADHPADMDAGWFKTSALVLGQRDKIGNPRRRGRRNIHPTGDNAMLDFPDVIETSWLEDQKQRSESELLALGEEARILDFDRYKKYQAMRSAARAQGGWEAEKQFLTDYYGAWSFQNQTQNWTMSLNAVEVFMAVERAACWSGRSLRNKARWMKAGAIQAIVLFAWGFQHQRWVGEKSPFGNPDPYQ